MTLSQASSYFIEYWEDLCSGISSRRDLLTIFNPRVVIQELLDEITLNKKTNKTNEEFFKRTLGSYLRNDPASNKRLKIHLQLILKEIDLSKKRPRYLPKFCSSTLKLFQDLEYLKDCIDSLIDLSAKSSLCEKDKEDIKLIANNMIVEFREIGYSEKEIREMPKAAFSEIQYINGHIFWEFPHQIVCNDWNDEDEKKKYWSTLEDYQNKLTESDRFKAFVRFAGKPKESIKYIFRVHGIEGSIELEIGEVLFYSPFRKKLVTDNRRLNTDKNEELFKNAQPNRSLNVATSVDAISLESGEIIARSKIESALDLCRRVLNVESTLWISASHIAIDTNGRLLSSGHHAFESASEDFTKRCLLDNQDQVLLKQRVVDLERVKNIAESNGWGRRFNEACYWLRRAEESNLKTDKLLSYWICLETLCAKSDDDINNWLATNEGQSETDIFLIKEVVGKLRAVGKCYQYGWLIQDALLRSIDPFPFGKGIKFSNHLIRKAQLNANPGEQVYLKNLICSLDEIHKEMPPILLREQIAELRSFYTNNTVALNVLKSNLQTTKDELAFIYRMRNKIAHDGSSNHPLLSSLCSISAEYAYTFFSQIKNRVLNNEGLDLRSVLLSGVQDYDLIEIRLQSEDPMKVFLSER